MKAMVLELVLGSLVVVVFFFGLWRLAVRQQNAGWVDVGWSLSFVFLVAWLGHFSSGYFPRRFLITILVAIWGLRLAYHVWVRLRKEGEEDQRYQFLRRHWGVRADAKFFWFFQGQGLANGLLVFPVGIIYLIPNPALGVWDILGCLIIAGSVFGESVADRQLTQWRAERSNRGKTCRRGLWAYSRHPNYFMEWCHWLAYPVFGLGLLDTPLAGWWWVTLIGPAVMYFLLNRVTGIPYTEKQAVKSRGDDYRKYQQEVSAFFPWFPKN